MAGMGDAGEECLVQGVVAQVRFESLREHALIGFVRCDVLPFDVAIPGPVQDRQG